MTSSLDVFLRPQSVALVGATDKLNSVGRAILENLQATSFGGPLYAVNPKRDQVFGTPCFASVSAIRGPVDLAVIVIPAPCVLDVILDCARAHVRGAVIVSAGFRETGPRGISMEAEIVSAARQAGMRIVGPNCVGVMSPHHGLNATFAASMGHPGHIALISQSGAICTAILDWSQQEKVGFSAFISTGTMADVEWGDLLDYLGSDENTRSILIYMESVPDAHKFASAARRVSRTKPVIVLKPGRTEAAARAAASHTGALTGRDDVLDAAFARCGVLRVDTIAELFNLAEVLDKQPPPQGPRLTMVTNAGGAGVLAADALLAAGGELADLAPATIERLNTLLPAHWSHHNPIDILGDADHARYAEAVRIALADPSTDGLLVALAPQAMTDPTAVAREITPILQEAGRPVLTSWMGGPAIALGEDLLNDAGIPTYRYPDSAVRAFQSMWRHSANVMALAEEPDEALPNTPEHPLITAALDRDRTLLTEAESKQLLSDFGIPTVPTIAAADPDAAVRAAEKLGYPVAVKLHSETITHKSDVGGVRLNIADEAGVRAAWDAVQSAVPSDDFLGVTVQPMIPRDGYELILGLSSDPQFGPVVLFGSGGTLVEVYKDRAIGLPPLNASLARRLMQRTSIYSALKGIRGRKPVDLAALESVLVNFTRLAVEQPRIQEIDINPLLASPERLIALDARIILHKRDANPAKPALLKY